MKSRLEAQLKTVPARPGVYVFRDATGSVLYIGKAKSLRPRVRSYFQKLGVGTRLGTAQLVERVADIETIVTGSEVEALHLEQNLVKRGRPPFNVRLRDDKSFPYIAVTVRTSTRAGHVHARAAPARRRVYFRSVRECEEGARDARRPQPGLQVPALRGSEAGPALGDPLPSTTTSTGAWRRAWATCPRRTTGR